MNIKYLYPRIGFLIFIILSPIILFLKYHEVLFPGILVFNILLGIIIISAGNSIFKNKVSRLFEIIGFVILHLIIYIDFAHIYLFKNGFTQSSVFIILETNPSESGAFFSMYMDWGLILYGALMFLSLVLSSILIFRETGIRIRNDKSDEIQLNKMATFFKSRYFFGVILILFSTYLYFNKYNFLPYNMVKGYFVHKENLEQFEKLGNDRLGGQFTEVSHDDSNGEEVVVLVLGESTTRNHMGIYGYYRDTNPLLNTIKDELFLYKNVSSPNTTTIPSLGKILTLGSTKNPERQYDGTLIQLFNKAGFNSYWISTQDKIGVNSSFVTAISKGCDEHIFLTEYDQPAFDGELLEPFTTVLSKDDNKKLIILHLMGTHSKYDERYPKSFHLFSSKPKSGFNHTKAHNYINDYDNAILYNDFVVYEFISALKKSKVQASLIYLSDHGEEVYQSLDMAGHWEDTSTKSMFEIPFIIWLSDSHKENYKTFNFNVDRVYNSEDLIYTLADLSAIEFKEFIASKSLVNKDYFNTNLSINKQK